MEDDKSLPVASHVGQNEPPVSIGSHTQPSAPIGDENRFLTYFSVLKMEATCSAETSVDFQRITACYISEDITLNINRFELLSFSAILFLTSITRGGFSIKVCTRGIVL
jgi:hypothetical protein